MSNHQSKDWTVLYMRDGTMNRVVIESDEQPTLNRIAIAVRDTLALDDYAIPDVVRGSSPEEQAIAFFRVNNIPSEMMTILAPGQVDPYLKNG